MAPRLRRRGADWSVYAFWDLVSRYGDSRGAERTRPGSHPHTRRRPERVSGRTVCRCDGSARDQHDAATGARPHQFGIGGSITASTRGAAGDVRYWFNDHIGLNMTAGWYRGYYETPSGQRPTTVHVSPSVIYMIGKPNYTREVDIRPFVGGASYLRATRPIVSPTANILTVESSGTGMHAFGGAELTFKDAEYWRSAESSFTIGCPCSCRAAAHSTG